MAKAKQSIAPSKNKDEVFILPGYLFEDVQKLENAKRELQVKLKLVESEYNKTAAEVQGIEGAIYAYFRTNALANGQMKEGHVIEYQGDFKYKVKEANTTDAVSDGAAEEGKV